MRNIIKNQLNNFNDNSIIHALKLSFYVSLIIMLFGAIFSGFQIVDEFEHLHASWLVSQGLTPYRDFFEHHHPLLWYISSPIVNLFYDKAIIFYIMRLFSFASSLVLLLYVYKLALFFTDKKGAWLAVVLTQCNIIMAYNFYQFRPDNFMNLFFLIGIYYWFYHIKNKELKQLIYSFLAFSISVLFLQKIGLQLVVIEFLLLILIFAKKMKIKDIIIASIPAICCLAFFIFYFIIKDAGYEYFALNFRFNQALVYYFERGAFWKQNIIFSIYGLGLIAILYAYKKGNIYFRLVSAIYFAEFFMRCFYFAPHPNYYTLLVVLFALVLSFFSNLFFEKNKLMGMLLIICIFINFGSIFNRLVISSEKHNSYNHFKLADYVHKNSDKNDLIMNGYDKNFNIFRKDASYYWFGLDMLIPVMEQEFGIKKLIDINEVILSKKPKFIYTQNIIDLRALRTYGETKYSQIFIPELLTTLYKPTPFDSLAQLK